ncbi:Hypothetical protein R9X50_00157800 [Acrodontium crateriforme]|uniref:Uncharacterized protein n=1 Tax=Acrodontium crateriforme TaxID=150365 RepID=A0AAQ3RA66_9PEZI|nr:Hypothetical protein R9X50_00157800 [Acrodontium crateriforme]
MIAKLDVLTRLPAPLRGRAQVYRSIDAAERVYVPLYWRVIAFSTSLMILGGYLMLPATFDSNPQLRVSKVALAIFAIALLITGFCITVLLSFAIPNALFHAENILLPSLVACAIGLLTILYNFLISSRYIWNLASLLLTIAGAITTIIYGILLLWTYRKIGVAQQRAASRTVQSMRVPLERSNTVNTSVNNHPFQEHVPLYYENYVQNMYPASGHHAAQSNGYDPSAITEEEMQRQQMLMLLLHKEEVPTPDLSSSTFHIDWQGREDDDTSAHGYYAPQSAPSSAYAPRPGIVRQWTNDLRPWDGVWRGVQSRGDRSRPTDHEQTPVSSGTDSRPGATSREQRRREIEAGK